MPITYNCANCGETIPAKWLIEAGSDYRCPHCATELDRRQFEQAKWQEQTKGAVLFFVIIFLVATVFIWAFTQNTVLALVLGPIIGAAGAAGLTYLLRGREL